AIFTYGSHQGIVIHRLILYARGLLIETATDTDDCDNVLGDLLVWAETTFQLVLARPARKSYQSELTFISEISLNALHPALTMLAERVQPFSGVLAPDKPYETSALILNLDDSNMKVTPGVFSIARRTGVSFPENTYFSAAPMPTGAHKQVLQDFEASLA